MIAGYRSPFRDWDRHATVRSMRVDGWPSVESGAALPFDRSSVVAHPAVSQSQRADAVAVGLLLGYLDFTTTLEVNCITPVSSEIGLGHLGCYSEELAQDAFRVQCDEAFHALLCTRLGAHVRQRTGLSPAFHDHHFLTRVAELRNRATPLASTAQFDFCAAVVAETVITKSLMKDWRDESLHPDLRFLLLQHYRDEARHCAFFSQALEIIWPQWDMQTRESIAPHWADLICAFTDPDAGVSLSALQAAGFSEQESCAIVEDCSGDYRSAEDRPVLRHTIHSLRRIGVISGDLTSRVAARTST
jgi:hypothetical protein